MLCHHRGNFTWTKFPLFAESSSSATLTLEVRGNFPLTKLHWFKEKFLKSSPWLKPLSLLTYCSLMLSSLPLLLLLLELLLVVVTMLPPSIVDVANTLFARVTPTVVAQHHLWPSFVCQLPSPTVDVSHCHHLDSTTSPTQKLYFLPLPFHNYFTRYPPIANIHLPIETHLYIHFHIHTHPSLYLQINLCSLSHEHVQWPYTLKFDTYIHKYLHKYSSFAYIKTLTSFFP